MAENEVNSYTAFDYNYDHSISDYTRKNNRSISNNGASEPKRTLSDGVIVREIEATKTHISQKIDGIEEVNKLWFHTISDQLQAIKRNATASNKEKPSDSVSSDQALNSIGVVLGDILNNQDTIINNTSSTKVKTAEQMDRAIDVIAESLSAIVTAQGQTARDLKSIKDTKYQQANDIDSLILKLTKELESVNRLKSEIHSLRVLYFLTIAIFIIIIIILTV